MPGGDDVGTAAREGMKLTYDDFLLFPDDGKRDETIKRRLYDTINARSN